MYIIYALVFVCLMSCGTKEKEVIREVEVPSAPPSNPPPPLEPERPNFLNFDQLEQYALNDLNSLNESDRLNTRYLLGCNFYNSGDKDLSFEAAGVNKGINSISNERLLTSAVSIDPTNCIWRVDISEFGVTRSLWRDFERFNLVQFISQSTRGTTLRFLTQSNQPLVFSSSFFTTVLGADQLSVNNGLYYKFLRQPANNGDFFRDTLGIDLNREIQDENILCAGGGNSRIALGKTRGICIVRSNNGFAMFTSDTSTNNPDSILANPFIFEIANVGGRLNTDKIFNFAALEVIYSLSNGLVTGYRLSNSGQGIPSILGGTAETIAPTNIVIDTEQSSIGFTPDITLGSCSNCHHQTAAIQFQDQVFRQVIGTGGFNAVEKDLAETFFRNDAFQAEIQNVNRQHSQALQEIGVSTLTQDPLVTGLIQPLRRELDVSTVASYTFLPVDEFKIRLNGTNDSKIIFGSLLNEGGTVQFADFAANYSLLIEELLLFRDKF